MSHVATAAPMAVLSVRADHQPEYARIPETCRLFGVSRAWLYREAGAGRVRMLKLNSSTLVDLSSVRAVLSELPTARIRPPRTSGKPGPAFSQ